MWLPQQLSYIDRAILKYWNEARVLITWSTCVWHLYEYFPIVINTKRNSPNICVYVCCYTNSSNEQLKIKQIVNAVRRKLCGLLKATINRQLVVFCVKRLRKIRYMTKGCSTEQYDASDRYQFVFTIVNNVWVGHNDKHNTKWIKGRLFV